MAADPAVGVTALAIDLVPEYDGDTSYPDAMLDVAADLVGPVVVLAGLPGAIDEDAAGRLRDAGIPVLEGFRSGLLALRHLLDAVDRPGPDRLLVEEGAPAPVARPREWQDLPAAYGIPTPAERGAATADEAALAARDLGFPVVLKTSAPGITHRSDVAGVVTGLHDAAAVEAAYADLAARLGPDVTVHEQVPAGVEVSVGLVHDHALGPMVVVAAGGVLVELLADRAVALPPLSRDGALADARPPAAAAAARRLPRRAAVDIDALVDVVVAVVARARPRRRVGRLRPEPRDRDARRRGRGRRAGRPQAADETRRHDMSGLSDEDLEIRAGRGSSSTTLIPLRGRGRARRRRAAGGAAPRSSTKRPWRAGCTPRTCPTSVGGPGLTVLQQVLVQEQVGRVTNGLAWVHAHPAAVVGRVATDHQRTGGCFRPSAASGTSATRSPRSTPGPTSTRPSHDRAPGRRRRTSSTA